MSSLVVSDTLSPPNTHTPSAVGRARSRATSLASLRAIVALMLREMSTRYGRSPGGYVWAFVEPVGALLVMSFVFSLLIRSPSLGNSFLLFYTTGYLPFLLYSLTLTSVMHALNFSRPLLLYPAVNWIDAILARFILNTLTSVAITSIVLVGILEFTDTTAVLAVGHMVSSLALAALLGLGHGTLNCALCGLFPVYVQFWSIASRPLLIAAGVFFLYEDLPANLQNVLDWTPWIHVTAMFRQGVYPTYAPDFISLPLLMAWALVPLMFGLLLLRRHRQRILMQ
ncbi:ABC transporter permease [Gymnodinialimonas ceratoperidinii]|uniref:Transport permease protein n=1 Tax=Gymnodinialimonas ceratoperidinii TaxID=2856823 RepID=A0A8F6YAE0_9RHOB|nr:ABC transporter permease [Gymnodinialimonas ceratoperidinii]QXT39849.1 ABC transporter permease [Gymnodinialimonas ceratoperidinii]